MNETVINAIKAIAAGLNCSNVSISFSCDKEEKTISGSIAYIVDGEIKTDFIEISEV